MAQSTLTLLLGVGAGFYPLQSFGLSLGDLEVDSRLNEALRARIEIVGVSDDEWRQIHATVAPATYSGDGPDHPEILDVITFRPMEDTEHRRFIEVRSSEALTEPLFDLPIQVSVAALQVIRSYSVLLDPAVRSADAPMLARGEASNAAVGEATVAVTGAGGASAGSQNGAAGQNSAATAVPVTQGIPVVPSAAPVGRGAMPAAQASKKGVSARSARKHRRGTHKRSSSKRAKTQGRVAAAAKAGPTSAAAGPGAAARARTSSANAPGSAAGGRQAAAVAEDASNRAAQEQLESQLASLQQALGQMQATIRAQDAEIANLTRAIAAQAQHPAAAQQPAPAKNVVSTAANDAESSEDGSASGGQSSGIVSRILYWLGGLAVLAVAAVVAVRRARKKSSPVGREVRSDEIRAELDELSQRMESRWTSPAARPSAGPAYEVSVDETEPRDGARAGSINEEPSSESDDGAGVSSGLDDWRTQSALLLADIPTDALPDADETVALPGADDTLKLEMTGETLIAEKETNTLSLADLERAAAMPTQGTSAIRLGRTGLEAGDGEATEELRAPREETRASSGTDRTASNREIVEVLESTLGIQPGRVDIQLKLLEIYHQEALGNRDNFHSLLRKLSLDPKTLTPAQLLHIETLQRTLDDGKRNAEVAEVGVSMG